MALPKQFYCSYEKNHSMLLSTDKTENKIPAILQARNYYTINNCQYVKSEKILGLQDISTLPQKGPGFYTLLIITRIVRIKLSSFTANFSKISYLKFYCSSKHSLYSLQIQIINGNSTLVQGITTMLICIDTARFQMVIHSSWEIVFKGFYEVHLSVLILCENWCSLIMLNQIHHCVKVA